MIFILADSFLFAELNDHDFSAGVSLGLLSGKTKEIVYLNNVNKDKLSQLDWDIKPLIYVGLDLRYSWQKSERNIGLFSNALLKFGMPGKSGTMEDRDWFDSFNYSTYPDWLTHYSEHENKTRFAILADFDVGLSYRFKNSLKLNFFLSYSFMYFSWEALGGSYLYPDWFTIPSHYFSNPSEKVITYKQFWNILTPGVSFYGELNRLFNAELSFKITPLIWLYSEDDHLNRPDVGVFYDWPRFGIFIEPGLLFNFEASKLVTLSLSYSYRFITGSRGDESYYSYVSKQTETFLNAAGAAYSVHNIGITVRFNLF